MASYRGRSQRSTITNDWFILGALTGAGSAITKNAIVVALDKLGLPMIRYTSMASGLILGKRANLFGAINTAPNSNEERAVGWLGDVVNGALFGILMSSIYKHTPKGNEVVKGGISGTILWMANMSAGHHLKIDGITRIHPITLFTNLITTTAFGAMQGWAFRHYDSHEREAVNQEKTYKNLPNEVALGRPFTIETDLF